MFWADLYIEPVTFSAAPCDASAAHTERTAYIAKQLMELLATGISRTERDVNNTLPHVFLK